jgi:hypothetical protein
MRLPTFFLLLAALAACVATGWVVWNATAETRAWREILRLSAKWPRTAAEEQQFQELVRKRLPLESPRRKASWVVSLDAPRRLLVITVPAKIEQSGDTLVQIHLFDADYRRISSTLANPGIGQRTILCHQGDPTDVGSSHFQVDSWLTVPGTFKLCQHYVLINDAPVLVRVEGRGGKLEQMECEDRARMLGPGLPDRTPEAWEESLSSSNLGEVLRTLMWLGGRHGVVRLAGSDRTDADHFDDVRRRPGVARKVAELTRSSHPWVAEAARAVVLTQDR